MFMRFSKPKAAQAAPQAPRPDLQTPDLQTEDSLAYYVPDTSVKKLRDLSAIDQMYGYYAED